MPYGIVKFETFKDGAHAFVWALRSDEKKLKMIIPRAEPDGSVSCRNRLRLAMGRPFSCVIFGR